MAGHCSSRLTIALVVAINFLVTGCNTITSSGTVSVDPAERWVLLPIENLSTSPMANITLSDLVETRLRVRGVHDIQTFEPTEKLNLVSLLDNRRQLTDAKAWALKRGFSYGLTGTVHEWHYKSGPDREPAVGVSLKLVDLANDRVLWQGSAARTGWGYSNLGSVADRVVRDLLKPLNTNQS